VPGFVDDGAFGELLQELSRPLARKLT